MMVKRKLVGLGAAAMLALGLAACSSGNEGAETDSTTDDPANHMDIDSIEDLKE